MAVEIFSDISKCGRTVGYCFIIARPWQDLETHAGQFVSDMESVDSEIASLAMALHKVERTPTVVAYTDIDPLPRMVSEDRAVSYQSKMTNSIEYLRWAIARHGKVELRIVHRKHGNYLRCDALSRAAARFDLKLLKDAA